MVLSRAHMLLGLLARSDPVRVCAGAGYRHAWHEGVDERHLV